MSEHQSDTVHLPGGRTVTLPGGVYTFVFGVLAVVTVVEVLLAELLKNQTEGGIVVLKAAVLSVLSLGKAVLVVWFYMHLNRDNPVYRWILGVPVFIALLSALFLLAVNPFGYQ